MARIKIFVSFDYQGDQELNSSFLGESKAKWAPFEVVGSSVREGHEDPDWSNKTKKAIRKCDAVIVVLGQDTHSAEGVCREVQVARDLGKFMFQVRHKTAEGTEVLGAGPVIPWKQNAIKEMLEKAPLGRGQQARSRQ